MKETLTVLANAWLEENDLLHEHLGVDALVEFVLYVMEELDLYS